MHCDAVHVAPPLQTLLQVPQLFGSPVVLTQALDALQYVGNAAWVHEGEHVPALVLHDVMPPFVGARQGMHDGPHEARLLATHVPPQKLFPVGHWHVPFEHCLPPAHANWLPQPPQFELSVLKSTQAPLQAV
jgi:hypothetical protein